MIACNGGTMLRFTVRYRIDRMTGTQGTIRRTHGQRRASSHLTSGAGAELRLKEWARPAIERGLRGDGARGEIVTSGAGGATSETRLARLGDRDVGERDEPDAACRELPP